MNKLLVGGAIAAMVIAMSPALAQTAPPPGVAQGTGPAAGAPMAAPAPVARTQMRMKFMGDRVMTRDEVVQHVREIFARFDTNKDGYVTREEMQAFHDKFANMGADMHRHLGNRGMMMGDRGAMFDRLDTNHDGVISRQEFMASQANVRREQRVIIMRDGAAEGGADVKGMHMHGMGMHGMGMGMGAHLFEMADANHDGRVSLQEAQNAALAHFDRADLNHDGKLTPDERRQAHKLMRSERRPS